MEQQLFGQLGTSHYSRLFCRSARWGVNHRANGIGTTRKLGLSGYVRRLFLEQKTRLGKRCPVIRQTKTRCGAMVCQCCKQRQETLLRPIKAIVDLQKDFFLTGDERNLKPMILKDVAERAGYDISTISEPATANTCKQISAFIRKIFLFRNLCKRCREEVSTSGNQKIVRRTGRPRRQT